MVGWPWPDSEVRYLAARALALLGEDVGTMAAVSTLLDAIRDHGDPADPRHGPVSDVRRWAKRQTATRLARWLSAAEAIAADVDGARRGRGDLVRIPGPPWGPAWRDMRDH